jgi:hypothetical protein
LRRAAAEQKGKTDVRAELLKLGYNPELVDEFLGRKYGGSSMTFANADLDLAVAHLLPRAVCEEHGVIPVLRDREGQLLVARCLGSRHRPDTRGAVEARLGERITMALAGDEAVREAIRFAFDR